MQDVGPAAPVTLRPAGLGLRLVAFVLDVLALLSCLMALVALGLFQLLLRTDGGQKDSEGAVWTAVALAVSWVALVPLYHVLLWAWGGQTLGQRAVHIRVVREDGGPPGLWRAVVRYLVYAISLLFLGIGFLPALWDERRRGLPDLVSGTMVVDTF
jgi:uncharacterized RDD family membrane protein YckC